MATHNASKGSMKKDYSKAHLEDLILTIRCLYPLQQVILSYRWEKEIMGYNWPRDHKLLYIRLLKAIALLFFPLRQKDDWQRSVVTREDCHLALYLMSSILDNKKPLVLLRAVERRCYRKIWQKWGEDAFTVREAMFCIHRPKSTTYKYIRSLMRINLARAVGKRGQAHLYQLQALSDK